MKVTYGRRNEQCVARAQGLFIVALPVDEELVVEELVVEGASARECVEYHRDDVSGNWPADTQLGCPLGGERHDEFVAAISHGDIAGATAIVLALPFLLNPARPIKKVDDVFTR